MSLTIDLDTCTDGELIEAARFVRDNFSAFTEYEKAHPDEDHSDAGRRKALNGLRISLEMIKRGLSMSELH